MDKNTPLCYHAVPKWEHKDGRKFNKQLLRDLEEFRNQMLDGQAQIIEHTDEIYLERQKQFFDTVNAAMKLVIDYVLKDGAIDNGGICVPDGWQTPPK